MDAASQQTLAQLDGVRYKINQMLDQIYHLMVSVDNGLPIMPTWPDIRAFALWPGLRERKAITIVSTDASHPAPLHLHLILQARAQCYGQQEPIAFVMSIPP